MECDGHCPEADQRGIQSAHRLHRWSSSAHGVPTGKRARMSRKACTPGGMKYLEPCQAQGNSVAVPNPKSVPCLDRCGLCVTERRAGFEQRPRKVQVAEAAGAEAGALRRRREESTGGASASLQGCDRKGCGAARFELRIRS